MTETGGTGDSLPGDPDGLAETSRQARTKDLKVQKLIRTSERGEQRIRGHGKDPRPELAAGEAHGLGRAAVPGRAVTAPLPGVWPGHVDDPARLREPGGVRSQ